MSTSTLRPERSNGSVLRGIGRLEKRVAAVKTPDALYAVVGSLARAVDGVRDEMADQCETVDQICHIVKKMADKMGIEY